MEVPEIIKLDESVINRIAAGEVIQRPANALKEMIENSLDAGSTNIQVTVKDGGLKLLEIQDNGIGIRKNDFTIVCERFTTSKLRNFEDLQNIDTYGFRGEALASISHVAHLTITSKTSSDICAYKASFVDGKLQGAPISTASTQGTIISIEDLFYNMHVRRRALRSPAEEYQKIADVTGKYAIHNAKVGFALRKATTNNDIRTQPASTSLENIRTIYGNLIARELVDFDVKGSNHLKFTATGLMTNVNYSTKKFTFLLFINHRLVECPSLKRCIDQVYSTYLPKNSHPFVYLSLEIEASNVDVNVHPTKHEVHFLNEELIVEAICNGIEAKLLASNNSRMFFTQAKLPGAPLETTRIDAKDDKKVAPKDLVRTDARAQKIDKFYGTPSSEKKEASVVYTAFMDKLRQSDTRLESVLNLRTRVENDAHAGLRDIFAQHVYVGSVDPTKTLIQYSTKLYLCNTTKILNDLFYEFVIYNFQNISSLQFTEPIKLCELALMGLDQPEVGWAPEDGDKAQLARNIVDILAQKSSMLFDYFGMEISNGDLVSIPLLLECYVPDLAGLPVFLVRLATEVDWSTESACFDSFARELALFYCEMNENMAWEGNDWKWITENIVYPAIKDYLIPSRSLAKNVAILEVANLPNLYKVFERC